MTDRARVESEGLGGAAAPGLSPLGRRAPRAATAPAVDGLPHLCRGVHPHPLSDRQSRAPHPLSSSRVEPMAVRVVPTARCCVTSKPTPRCEEQAPPRQTQPSNDLGRPATDHHSTSTSLGRGPTGGASSNETDRAVSHSLTFLSGGIACLRTNGTSKERPHHREARGDPRSGARCRKRGSSSRVQAGARGPELNSWPVR